MFLTTFGMHPLGYFFWNPFAFICVLLTGIWLAVEFYGRPRLSICILVYVFQSHHYIDVV